MWAMVEWMLPHPVDLFNWFLVGSDGKTSYYRVYLFYFNGLLFEMGGEVLAKHARKVNLPKLDPDPKRKLHLKSNVIKGTRADCLPDDVYNKDFCNHTDPTQGDAAVTV